MKYRKFQRDNVSAHTYYVPVDYDTPNAADEVLIDTHEPNSRGFGGRTFTLETTEDTIDSVQGPWHGMCPYEVAPITELHRTKVTILRHATNIPYSEWEDISEDDSLGIRFRMRGEIVYDEQEWVLGHFSRGDRIAQQLSNLWQEELWLHVETDGGSHSYTVKPGAMMHPMSTRRDKADDGATLSTEQMHAATSGL